MGLPRKSTNGLGSPADIDLMRVPLPAARIRHWLTFFIDHLPGMTFEIPPETFAPMSKIPGGKNIDSECPVRPTRLSLVTSPFSMMRASGKRQVSPFVPVVNTSPFIERAALSEPGNQEQPARQSTNHRSHGCSFSSSESATGCPNREASHANCFNVLRKRELEYARGGTPVETQGCNSGSQTWHLSKSCQIPVFSYTDSRFGRGACIFWPAKDRINVVLWVDQ